MRSVVTIALLLTVAIPTARAEDAGALARRLADLRTDVDGLAETLDVEREALRADLRSHELRSADLEARIRQEEIRLAELERMAERQREALQHGDVATEVLVPMLVESLDRLEATIAASLPYRLGDRAAAVGQLREQVEAGTLDPRKAVGRAWQLVEDELRLGRENALDRQVVALDGRELLVEVARVGMVGLFFRTPDGVYGHAARTSDGFAFARLDPDGARQAEALFDALKKQIRVGWFDLPWTLPEVSR